MTTNMVLTKTTTYDNMAFEATNFSTATFFVAQNLINPTGSIGLVKGFFLYVWRATQNVAFEVGCFLPHVWDKALFVLSKKGSNQMNNNLRKAILRELAQHVRRTMAVLGVYPSSELVKQTVTLSQFEARFKALSQRDKVTVLIFVLVLGRAANETCSAENS